MDKPLRKSESNQMIINSVACMQKNSKKFENCVGFSTSRSERVKDKFMRGVSETHRSEVKNARKLDLPASKVIPIRMHANSDTHAQRMRVCQEDAISFTSMGALFKRS